MLARIGIYFLVILLTCSAILGGVYYMQGVEERNALAKYAVEQEKQKQARIEIANRPRYETRPLPYGLAQRPTDTIYVEIPPVRKQPFYSPELGQISQNIFALALTFAAEHELSLRARERFRGHTWPNDKDPKWAPYQTHVVYVNQGDKPALNFMVTKQAAPGEIRKPGSFHFQKKVEIPAETLDDLTEPGNIIVHTLRISEELSRNDIKQLLLSDGYKGEPIKRTASFTIPDDINSLLDQYHELAQYAAITKLQTLLKENGESPELLAALSRACIQFASLTEHLTWPIDRYYKARGLFYAQRMTALYPEHPQSKWTMLYALGLGGFHSCALPLFDKYESEPGDKPAWFAPLAAFCRFDFPKLTELTNDDVSNPLASYLLTMTHLNENGPQKLASASRFLQENPDCLRVYEILMQEAPLGITVSMPSVANRMYAETRSEHLSSLDTLTDLKELDQKLLGDQESSDNEAESFVSYNELISSLRKLPSFQQRADLQELAELLIAIDWWFAERLNVKAHWWGINSDEILEPHLDLIEHHYQKDNYALYQDNKLKRKQIGDAFLKAHNERYYLDRFNYLITPNTDRTILWNSIQRMDKDVDKSYYDAMNYSESYGLKFGKGQQIVARTIVKSSPRSPYSVIHKLNEKPEEVDLDKIKDQYIPHMTLALMIGRHYYNQGEFAKAVEHAEKMKPIHPDDSVYELESDSLYYAEESERHIDVWKKFLSEVNALGLEHVGPSLKIAEYYLRQGRYEDALPYIESAAETYSGSGLTAMIRYYHSIGERGKASIWLTRSAQRYPTGVPGDILMAALIGNPDLVQRFVQQMETSGYMIDSKNYADVNLDNFLISMLLDREEDMVALAPQYFKRQTDDILTYLLYAIVRFNKDGDKHFQDARAQQISLNRNLFHLEKTQHIVTTKERPTQETLTQLDDYILHHEHPKERAGLRMILGMALLHAGHNDLAIPYLKNAAASPDFFHGMPHVAAYTLLEMETPLDSPRPFDIDQKTTETDDLLTKAEYLTSFKAYDRALEVITKILEEQPTHRRAVRFNAVCLRLKGNDIPAARKAYEAVLANEPEAWSFHENLGLLCEQEGDSASAIKHYQTVLEKRPEYPAAESCRFRLAMLYAASQDEAVRNPELAEKYRAELKSIPGPIMDAGYRIRQALIYSALNNSERHDAFMNESTRVATPESRSLMQKLAKQTIETFPYKRSDDWAKLESEFLTAK
ncbi:tetratricopeptide repeat protein [Lacunimicrobium album]